MLPNDADSHLRYQKKRKGRHNFKSAASITMMSGSPEPPERLAEILLEILALSNPTRTSQSKPVSGSDSIELSDGECVKEQSESREEDNNGERL
jgi:hypothetical protein